MQPSKQQKKLSSLYSSSRRSSQSEQNNSAPLILFVEMATLKGGAGKTINIFNISGILAESNKILLIDVDPQCNLSSNCGMDVSD